jgi:glutamyl-tRNA reductase
VADERILSRLVVVGASHRTSSEATRDRLFISEDDLPGFLTKVSPAGFSEAVAMSTCTRTEIFGLAEDGSAARIGAIGLLSDLGGFDREKPGDRNVLSPGRRCSSAPVSGCRIAR